MGKVENSKSVEERKENKQILQKLRPNISLEAITKMLRMRYFEHVMGAHQSLAKGIMLGITGGARKKGKPRMRWMNDVKSVTGLLVNDLNRLVKYRKKWNLLVNKIVKKKTGPNI